jgi:hypothetical protein
VASKRFVFVKLDFPNDKSKQPKHIVAQNERLAAEFSKYYQFRGYPSIYLARPDGTPYAMTGYQQMSPETYVEHLIEMQEQFNKNKP